MNQNDTWGRQAREWPEGGGGQGAIRQSVPGWRQVGERHPVPGKPRCGRGLAGRDGAAGPAHPYV